MMQDQQNMWPHLVELLFFTQSQHILQRGRCTELFAFYFCGYETIQGGFGGALLSYLLAVNAEQRVFAALITKVASRRQPSTAQLTSLIWSFLQVQTQLIPNRDSMNVKCLFHPSIYTINTNHSTLLIMSQALPNHFPTPSLSAVPTADIIFNNLYLPLQSLFPYSKPRPLVSMIFATKGRKRFLPTNQRIDRRILVFLLSSTPSFSKCYYLYMAMQVYSSPSLRLQQSKVVRVQQISGSTLTNCLKNGEACTFLLKLAGNNSVRAVPKSRPNLCLSFYSKSWSRNTQGLLLCCNIAVLD